MMHWKLSLLALVCLFAFSVGLYSVDEIKDAATNVTFPKTVTFDYQGKNYTLQNTGVSTRKKFFIKVYSIASYIQDAAQLKGGNVFKNILDSKNAKQLTFIWVRNVEQKRVRDGYQESLDKVIPKGTLAAEIDKFVNFFGDVKTNDKHIIRWLPDGTVTIQINGTDRGDIKSEDFAKALWAVWFGDHSVVSRNQLVSELK